MDSIENLKKSLDDALDGESALAGKQGPNTVSTPPINPVAKSNTQQTGAMQAIGDALNGAKDIMQAVHDGIENTQKEANKPISQVTPMPPRPPISPTTSALNSIGAMRAPQVTTESKLSSNQRRVK